MDPRPRCCHFWQVGGAAQRSPPSSRSPKQHSELCRPASLLCSTTMWYTVSPEQREIRGRRERQEHQDPHRVAHATHRPTYPEALHLTRVLTRVLARVLNAVSGALKVVTLVGQLHVRCVHPESQIQVLIRLICRHFDDTSLHGLLGTSDSQ